MLRLPLSVLSLFALALPAQDAEPPPKTLRVHVIGASVSGGFRDGPTTGAAEPGDSVTMQQLLRPWAGEHATVTTHNTVAMTMLFMDPLGTGKEQIDGVAKARPDVVVAIDFLFWFAYGHVDLADEAAARQAQFAKGLELLGTLTMPVVVGDLPDMTGAERRMLKPKQIPSAEVLKALNAELAKFVQAHPNVHLVPLAETVRQMRTEGAKLPLQDGVLQTAPGALQQADKLHANRLGMALLGLRLQDALRACFPAEHPLARQQWTFEQFVEAAGAEDVLDQQREVAAEAAAGK
ncbi:MAG: hypothetical protein JNL08_16705 [Planctomycetes bacterium]|nr:hypothetical protein [Planctomycetota bacterium]